jgi:hypothetical protein
MHNAGLLGRASKVGSILYRYLPLRDRNRGNYQQLTGWAMQLLKDEWDEADIISELLPTLPISQTEKCLQPKNPNIAPGLIIHPNGQYHFISSLYKRFTLVDNTAPPPIPICHSNLNLVPVAYW